MAKKHGRKHKQHNIVYTIVTAFVLFAVFICMVGYLYSSAKAEAYENLHVQTKQIKDDIHLQLISDRENLATMANFAAKLYGDGESYDLMFASFKPIGLIANIGILRPDNTFVTKAGSIDLDGRISFADEAAKGAYVSGRVKDLTRENAEIIRTAVPIVVNDQTVGILYGVIKPETIGARYNAMVQEFDAQLFVYSKENGDLVIDTLHTELGNISFLEDRVYNEGYSYEEMATTDKGFTSFMSAYKDENMHLHYSTIDDIGWMIAMARYDSQVFATTHALTRILLWSFAGMLIAIFAYIVLLMTSERRINAITDCASDVRKELLETVGQQNNIHDALDVFCKFTKAKMLMLYDDSGADHIYYLNESEKLQLPKNERRRLKSILSRLAAEQHRERKDKMAVMCIKPNEYIQKADADFYALLKEYAITEISFAAVVDNANHATILAAINPKRGKVMRMLAEKVVACFSMALYNKRHLEETETAATIDALTGLLNNDTYIEKTAVYDAEKSKQMSCVYVDVNGLHICNNRYGHAAGNEMLVYIASALREVFKGHTLFRLGGDEFMVLAKETAPEVIARKVQIFREKLEAGKYSASIGVSYREENDGTADMVKEAEVKMYKEKEAYYQDKRERTVTPSADCEYVQVNTGIAEIDTMLSVLKENYNGIYRVSLDMDTADCILMPAYLGYDEHEEGFSKLFLAYVDELVEPDYHRNLTNLVKYDSLKRQLSDGETPRITYSKTNGEQMVLSIYKLDDTKEDAFESLWVFGKR